MIDKSNELYNEFNTRYTPEKLKDLTLAEYTNLDKTSFCYWVETKTEALGSIWGGSSFKFGVYERNDKTKEFDNKSYLITDGTYGWVGKYGTTAEEAFQKVKSIIINIQQAAQSGDYEAIDKAELGDAYKWKIAFLYSNKKLISVFNPNNLRRAAWHLGMKNVYDQPVSQVQRYLQSKQDDQNIFEYSSYIWKTSKKEVKTFWLYSPGEKATKWDQFYSEGIMALGWDKLGNLTAYGKERKTAEKQIENDLIINYDSDVKDKRNDRAANYHFCYTMKEGDIIIVKEGINKILGYGIVTSNYYYDENATEYKHRRNVAWKLNQPIDFSIPVQKTLSNITDKPYCDELISLLHINEAEQTIDPDKQTASQTPQPPMDIALNTILCGPPGTGKTYRLQHEYANKFSGKYEFITFHQKYSYEDFMIGITPVLADDNTNNSTLCFKKQTGIFYNCCLEALRLAGYNNFEECYQDKKEDRAQRFRNAAPYAIFIDEINRANISAVFGELISCIEEDKRIGNENELWVKLPLNGGYFAVPRNLYIIGTMNTADRSIALLDIALRRRFTFERINPDYNHVSDWAKEMLQKLNEQIYKVKRTADFNIGHSFFMNKTENEKQDIFDHKIIPLLYEYFQNNTTQVKKILEDAGIPTDEKDYMVTIKA